MTTLKYDFIRKAERVTSFNIKAADFQTMTYKKELQHLFNKHFFPDFDLSSTISTVDESKLNKLISDLKLSSNEMFVKLHAYNLKGIGPGEATLFFLIDTAVLGGGSSAGVDLIVNGTGYEVKAVKVSADRIASDFKLGGTVPLADIMTELNNLRETLKLGGSKTEISGTITQAMRTKDPKRFAEIENKYAEAAYQYFKQHEVIFINNAPGARLGRVEAIKRVAKKDIMIERVTSGTVKPKIRL